MGPLYGTNALETNGVTFCAGLDLHEAKTPVANDHQVQLASASSPIAAKHGPALGDQGLGYPCFSFGASLQRF